ncbi:triose-phosphate isomerase [Candidatus Falkowbacteria bacterium CG10_big_fil_rev_8_21_14_0_10_37_6]|uniref:Triosephosphate isomerase n=1 Tax=Candidatus Falkowbacteria bacterium CG10_big_fil_rev_8_21_14_0_10_37_6 TaxID=1974563 RepID=A0A2H0V756_9BACT|nr:MAG: triose-phosphate isomerase [Candidatus Falkowbacteria bacterium CG10_big_fil_rev_8_21_14_0_10_37_6]
MKKQRIIIANWKMKLGLQESIDLAEQYKKYLNIDNVEVAICASEFALTGVKKAIGKSGLKFGAQNVFWEAKGAYTGEMPVEVLTEIGADFVIVGHSERRQNLLENYQMIHQKVKAVLGGQNIIPVVCVGETVRDRETDKAEYVITEQLQQSLGGVRLLSDQKVIIAYEPIWAIGTGQAIKPEDAQNMHEVIHASLVDIFGIDIVKKQIRIIYGGSVDSKNIKGFASLDNVDGLLIGGASLDVKEFKKMVDSL